MKNILHMALIFLTAFNTQCTFDVTFFASYNFADGIGKRAIGQIQTLKDDLKVNYKNSRKYKGDKGVADDIESSVLAILRHPDKTPGTILLLLDSLYDVSHKTLVEQCSQHKIKLAYITVESTKGPASWVEILNNNFDGIAVPDESCTEALRASGLKIPVFILPEILYLDEFLKVPLQEKPHNPFSFGVSATALNYKNYDLLLEAFAAEYKNRPDVILKIHNHLAAKSFRITNKIKSLGLENVIATHGPIKKEMYEAHMQSIDCYVLLSKGEGFSATPREALALGRPCILSNHTAHRTLCNTGYVRAVEAPIIEKHDENYKGENVGDIFNCKIEDVRAALRDVYDHYDHYLYNAHPAREWVKQYLGENLKTKFISFLKPKKVILGDKNEIMDDCLITDSKDLFDKYMRYVVAPDENGEK